MNVYVRPFEMKDLPAMTRIWNIVVEEGNAFPQEKPLSAAEAPSFFAGQTFAGVAEDRETGQIVGLYILHPNNVGRCSHIANASYAVDPSVRGEHIGRSLVLNCIDQARSHGYTLLQFNAVVADNAAARHLYEEIGFQMLGTLPHGFRKKDGSYEDICLYYIDLQK